MIHLAIWLVCFIVVLWAIPVLLVMFWYFLKYTWWLWVALGVLLWWSISQVPAH